MSPETTTSTSLDTAPANALRGQLLALYQLPALATDAEIVAAAESVQRQHLAEKARREQEAADELLIKSKTDAGLSRGQAIGVIERQRKYDAAMAAARAERSPQLLEILEACNGDTREARRRAHEKWAHIDTTEFQAAVADYKKSIATT